MILVAGATGLVGREACRLLRERGKTVRALVRKSSNADVVQQLKSQGVELFFGDLKERRTLDEACRGVQAVISTATSTISRQERDSIDTVDGEGQRNLIAAAAKSGVKRFVFISYNHQRAPVGCSLTDAKVGAEKALMASGMEYTILRAGFFMEVWLSPTLGFDAANAKATLYGDGTKPISWISFFDVAAFAVASVDSGAARNQIIEIGGKAMSPNEVVDVFEKTTGRKFEVQRVPVEALRGQYDAATDPLQKSFACLMLTYANGDPVDGSAAKKLMDRPLKSVRDYAQQFK